MQLWNIFIETAKARNALWNEMEAFGKVTKKRDKYPYADDWFLLDEEIHNIAGQIIMENNELSKIVWAPKRWYEGEFILVPIQKFGILDKIRRIAGQSVSVFLDYYDEKLNSSLWINEKHHLNIDEEFLIETINILNLKIVDSNNFFQNEIRYWERRIVEWKKVLRQINIYS